MNLDSHGMRFALRTLAQNTNSGDEVFFYYSGHGMALRATANSGFRSYLLGTSFRAEDEVEAVRNGDVLQVSEVVERLERTSAKVRIIVFDACRSSVFSRMTGELGFVPVGQIETGRGTFLGFSARQGQITFDKAPESMEALMPIRWRVDCSNPIEIFGLLFGDVGSDVRRLTTGKQFPEYRDSLDGRYYFNLTESLFEVPTRGPTSHQRLANCESLTSSARRVNTWNHKDCKHQQGPRVVLITRRS